MKVSFEGIGQWCATFLGDVSEGGVVKVSGAGQAADCEAGDPFCGAAVCAGEGACTVQMGGFVTVPYSGTAPAPGYTALTADGLGGVKTAGGTPAGESKSQEAAQSETGDAAQGGTSEAVTAPAGRSYWVVDVDESGKTVTILL